MCTGEFNSTDIQYRADQKNLSTPFKWRWRRKAYKMAVAHIIKNVRQALVLP